MADHFADPVRYPEHYTVYPVQPIEITRHLGFCLGNAIKYVLRAPWKGGVDDCDHALRYLRWEQETPQEPLDAAKFDALEDACMRLEEVLEITPGDDLWCDLAYEQARMLELVRDYLEESGARWGILTSMEREVTELRRILALRDTTGQIYEGKSGRPIRNTMPGAHDE